MNVCIGVRSSRPARPFFSFGLFDGLRVHLRSRIPRDGIHEESGLVFPRLYERISWSKPVARRYDQVEGGW